MTRPTGLTWAIQSLVPQMMLRREARAGQLGARLAIDRRLWDDPYPIYEQMRSLGRLQRGRLVSATVSHEMSSEILRSPSFGVDMSRSQQLAPLARKAVVGSVDPWAVGPIQPPSMLAVDPPDHTRYRRLVSKVFTARAVAALEDRVVEITDELLTTMSRRGGSLDLVGAFAAPLPVRVIAEILGVPDAMQPEMLTWGNAAATTLEPAITYRQYRDAHRALRRIHRWLADHLDHLREQPGDDLLSKLAVLVDDGETLNDVELRATALLVIGAGFETTVNLIGNGVAWLLAKPDQRAALRDDPSLWTNAVDEILRIDAPVQATARIAMSDVEICGEALPAGSFVVTMLGGANRDPDVFADPTRFDVTRANARDHLAFSGGIHFCLGASLARLEGAKALRMLFERFPELAAVPGAVRRKMRVLRGYDVLPVNVGAAQPARILAS